MTPKEWLREPFTPLAPALDLPKRAKERLRLKEVRNGKLCQAAFAQAMGKRWRGGLALLDYGCGSGRFANFLSARLASFRYWGVEPEPYATDLAVRCWSLFPADSRIAFGRLPGPTLDAGVFAADVALLLSVFTHLPHRALPEVIAVLHPIAQRGGALVFSCFLGDDLAVGREKIPGEYYHEVYYTYPWLRATLARFDLRPRKVGEWKDGPLTHSIIQATWR